MLSTRVVVLSANVCELSVPGVYLPERSGLSGRVESLCSRK